VSHARWKSNSDEYLKRWGLRSDHPLTAPAYSERRSTLAKALGLGRKPKAAVLPAVTPTAAPTPVDVVKDSQATPARGRRSRSAAKSVDGGNEVVAEPKSARKRGSRSRVASPKRRLLGLWLQRKNAPTPSHNATRAQGQDPTVRVERGARMMALLARVVGGHQVLAPVLDPFDRPSQSQGGEADKSAAVPATAHRRFHVEKKQRRGLPVTLPETLGPVRNSAL
jgi:hypothetical protein